MNIFETFDWSPVITWLALAGPIALCLGLQFINTSGKKNTPRPNEIDQWYVPEEINKVYNNIKQEIILWRKEEPVEENKSLIPFRKQNKPKQERLAIYEEIPPRLLRIDDVIFGEIVFELTESLYKGTSIRINYNSIVNYKMQRYRAKTNVKLPLIFQGDPCKYCGLPIYKELIVCPNCGKKLI